MIQTTIVGSFLILPVFAFKNIEISRPIVESKNPTPAAVKTPVFKFIFLAPKKPKIPYI
jgi:hypothetical protein